MEILDKKSNRMSRANAGVSERSEFPDFLEALSEEKAKALFKKACDNGYKPACDFVTKQIKKGLKWATNIKI